MTDDPLTPEERTRKAIEEGLGVPKRMPFPSENHTDAMKVADKKWPDKPIGKPRVKGKVATKQGKAIGKKKGHAAAGHHFAANALTQKSDVKVPPMPWGL